jgi:ketosteroid isomerase-like protein
MTHPSADARSVLQSYLDALLEGNLDKIADSFADDATWSLHGDLPLSGVRRGRQEIVDFLTSGSSLYAPGTQQFTFRDIVAEGDTAVLEWGVTGTASTSGKSYDNEYCGVFVIRDGRIAEVREYLDSLHARETLFAPAG